MKTFKIIVFLIIAFLPDKTKSQTIDSLVDVGSHKLHFRICPGKGMPIIFESGAGNDGAVWLELMKLLRAQTDAPLIAYDRAGFGKSGMDTLQVKIEYEVKNLNIALKKLGYSTSYFFVAHSLGGNYAMKFIAGHPKRVKGAVFIDVVNPYFMTEERATYTKSLFAYELEEIKKESIGFYFLLKNYEDTNREMREAAKLIKIPLTIIASGITPFEGEERVLFKKGLERFAKDRKNRKYLLVENAEHFVFYDAPDLVADEIIKLYNQMK